MDIDGLEGNGEKLERREEEDETKRTVYSYWVDIYNDVYLLFWL